MGEDFETGDCPRECAVQLEAVLGIALIACQDLRLLEILHQLIDVGTLYISRFTVLFVVQTDGETPDGETRGVKTSSVMP